MESLLKATNRNAHGAWKETVRIWSCEIGSILYTYFAREISVLI